MIANLTAEQQALLPQIRDKWLKIGLSTEPLDYEAAQKWVAEAYRVVGLPGPARFFRFPSPFAAAIGATMLKGGGSKGDQVRDQVRDQVGARVWDQVRDQVWDQVRAQVREQVGAQVRDQVGARVWEQAGEQVGGQIFGAHEAPWLAFYDAFRRFGLRGLDAIEPLSQLAGVCGWWAPYKTAAILQDRPSKLLFDGQNRAHCATGKAIEYRDGFGVYIWHGTRIPGEWIEAGPPAPHEALQIASLEQRRAACEMLGWDRILAQLPHKVISIDPNPQIGQLLETELPDIGPCRFLKVQCATGRTFALAVPREMQTARQANAWTYHLEENDYQPEIRL